MPGLPDGVGIYYDVEPQHDERYFRAMVNEATKLRREFTQAYQTATSLGDRESKIAANELRALLENRKGEILDRKSFFPQEIQEKITTQVEKIQFILDKNPPFDTRPALVTPALTNEPHNPQPRIFLRPNLPPLFRPNLNPVTNNFIGPRLPLVPAHSNHHQHLSRTMTIPTTSAPITTVAPTAANFSTTTVSRPLLQTNPTLLQVHQTSMHLIAFNPGVNNQSTDNTINAQHSNTSGERPDAEQHMSASNERPAITQHPAATQERPIHHPNSNPPNERPIVPPGHQSHAPAQEAVTTHDTVDDNIESLSREETRRRRALKRFQTGVQAKTTSQSQTSWERQTTISHPTQPPQLSSISTQMTDPKVTLENMGMPIIKQENVSPTV